MLDLEDIPACPQDEQEVLTLLASEDVELEALARAIDRNPGLSANILGLANSAYYHMGEDVCSTREAIIRVLGLPTVKSLSLSLLLGSVFDNDRCAAFDLQQHWAQALCTAVLARSLAEHGLPEFADEAYLCGLLHDFGTLLLVHVYPEEMQEILAGSSEPALIRARQLRSLGLDSGRAGSLLSERWSLPRSVGVVSEYHWDERYAGELAPLCRLVGAAAIHVHERLRGRVASSATVLAAHASMNPETMDDVLRHFEEEFEDVAAIARQLGNG